MLVRLAHYLVAAPGVEGSPGTLWLFGFADDFVLLAEGSGFAHTIIAVLLIWTILGVPLAWRKCRGGRALEWVGCELHLQEFALGISERRAQWVSAWYAKTLAKGTVSLVELRAAVGRICFVCGALRYDRPFLAPIYALVGALARKRRRIQKWPFHNFCA